MDTKAAFEKWFERRAIGMKRNGLGLIAIAREKSKALEAWQASRAAIEIELPEEFHSESWLGNGCCDDYANTKIAECRKAITSHGIRIKGRTE